MAEFGRRTFLGAVGVAAVAGGERVAGGGRVPAADRDWSRLRLTGRLVLPADADYDTARRPYNAVYAGNRPAAVALCADEADVARCLEFASAERLPVAARSGRHSYAGYSTPPDGLVVDVSALREVRPGGVSVVGAGTSLLGAYEALGAAGRLLPGGTCRSVGIAGLALGGGIGVVGRKYGLTCDRLVGARVVTPDGSVRDVDAEREPDLFWALRGGGGGNFGVVTSFRFDTPPAHRLVPFELRTPAGAAVDVLGAWQEWLPGLPDELWTACRVETGRPARAVVSGCWAGPPEGLGPWLDRLAAKVPVQSRTVRPMDYVPAMRYFAGCTGPNCPPVPPTRFVASSRMPRRPVDPAVVVGLLARERPVAVLFDSFGGAIGRVGAAETAFPHRDALASAQVYVTVRAGDEAGARRDMAVVRDGLGADGGYVNYVDPELPDWRTAYYGANLPRLRRVADRYDPNGVLAFAQSVRA
ncbi:FAD-binding oxidoreductase [Saccharothrix obliqua]|uniref:FAD-binding oxidoreductase n=1 Tax=Saccharothrix obliqua TaxID=2861747 RepID=UPI001C602710|nr:FAD-binding oxidoreductase [Saccharothrix obliqua]MBW4721784.1 FAD-binding oxidoreductase [Saccharothrix obliqua]